MLIRRAPSASLLVAAAVVGAVGAVAFAHARPTATIVPQRGMGGVELTMTQAEVRSKAGAPLSVRRGRNDFGRFTEFRYPLIRVFFQGDASVTNVRTTSAAVRTRNGAGVGSTERQLRAKLRGVRCRTDFRIRHCWLGAFRPGRRVTDFLIQRGRAVRVDVGFVID